MPFAIVGSPNSKIGAAKRCAGTLRNVMALEGAIPALAEVAGWRFGLTSARRLRLFAEPTIRNSKLEQAERVTPGEAAPARLQAPLT